MRGCWYDTVVEIAFASDCPPLQIAFASLQARFGSSIRTSSVPVGVAVMRQPWSFPAVVRPAAVTVAPCTLKRLSRTVSSLIESGAALKRSSNSNAVPSWFCGTSTKFARGFGGVVRPAPPWTAAPLWSSTASALLATLRMAPPLSARLFGVTPIVSCSPSP